MLVEELSANHGTGNGNGLTANKALRKQADSQTRVEWPAGIHSTTLVGVFVLCKLETQAILLAVVLLFSASRSKLNSNLLQMSLSVNNQI